VTTPPPRPKIYHVTHLDNRASIVEDGALFSNAEMISRGGPAAAIGMSEIKSRRLQLPVACNPGSFVGEYVPFYFCPRSVMLYLLHCGNHPKLVYRGGQRAIMHLEADLHDVFTWAREVDRPWAFSLSNAGAYYAEFRRHLSELDQVDWDAVDADDWAAPEVKEGKQAEFLVHRSVLWTLVSRVGVQAADIRTRAIAAMTEAEHRPRVKILPNWYY
jgi:hypothetical protein